MASSVLSKGVIFGAALCILLISLTDGQSQQKKRALAVDPSAAIRELSGGIRNFTIELLYHTARNQGNHLVISPFSVWAVLTIISEGASGETFLELARKLRLPIDMEITRTGYTAIEKLFNVNTPTVELATVSKLYTDIKKKVNPTFDYLMKTVYKAGMLPVNFQNVPFTLRQINNDVATATRGKIKEIVTEDDLKEAQLILTNAVFFKGQWTIPFNSSETEKAPFFDENGKQIGLVNMMYQKGPFAFVNLKKFQANILELPYGKENRLSMLVMLPHNKVPLTKMFQNLAVVSLEEMFERLDEAAEAAEDTEVEVWLPRFKIESDITMNKPLNDVGIFEVFDPIYAELPLISKNTYLSKVIHKAVIEVTEEGTTASAVTGAGLYDRMVPPKYKANKPFVYFLVEKTTNIIVFAGIYSNPSLY